MTATAIVERIETWVDLYWPTALFDAEMWRNVLDGTDYTEVELRRVLTQWVEADMDRPPFPAEVAHRLRLGRERAAVKGMIEQTRRELRHARTPVAV